MLAGSRSVSADDSASSVPRLALAAIGGVSAWVSLGTQAITNDATLARVAALPPLLLLAILVVTFAVAAGCPNALCVNEAEFG